VTLLVMFSLWQMPHSYAIAIFRFKDYSAANIPVLPVARHPRGEEADRAVRAGLRARHLDADLRRLRRPATWPWQLPWACTGCTWPGAATRPRTTASGRKVFGFSILTVTALSVMMGVDSQTAADVLMTYAR
jgi:protoheme IX farnesyltransferase